MGGSAGAIGADKASYWWGEEADIQICKFGSHTQTKYSDRAQSEQSSIWNAYTARSVRGWRTRSAWFWYGTAVVQIR